MLQGPYWLRSGKRRHENKWQVSNHARSPIETQVMPRHAQIFFIGSVSINCTSDMLQVDSPPLLPKEMEDINDFYDSPEDHKVDILEKLLEELHDARCRD